MQNTKPIRQFSFLDQIIGQVEDLLHSHHGAIHSDRPYPAETIEDGELTDTDKKHSAGLMRVNHSGEICAQALYCGQMVTAQNQATREMLEQSRQEEVDHLDWCQRRLHELGYKPSLLNPFWYAQSFTIGVLTGLAGDGISLGFVEETEAQVQKHLQSHLNKLSPADQRSKAIIIQMEEDEKRHGDHAHEAGGKPLPSVIKTLMSAVSKVMTRTSYYF
jgi:ubiquinone biosynthesis monooxygenase Coq7